MHKKKEDTMQRISRRKYEEKNKVERQSKSGNFQTMIPRATFEEINGFLKENNITKVQLIIEGYKALKEQQEKKCLSVLHKLVNPSVTKSHQVTLSSVFVNLNRWSLNFSVNQVQTLSGSNTGVVSAVTGSIH